MVNCEHKNYAALIVTIINNDLRGKMYTSLP